MFLVYTYCEAHLQVFGHHKVAVVPLFTKVFCCVVDLSTVLTRMFIRFYCLHYSNYTHVYGICLCLCVHMCVGVCICMYVYVCACVCRCGYACVFACTIHVCVEIFAVDNLNHRITGNFYLWNTCTCACIILGPANISTYIAYSECVCMCVCAPRYQYVQTSMYILCVQLMMILLHGTVLRWKFFVAYSISSVQLKPVLLASFPGSPSLGGVRGCASLRMRLKQLRH